MKDWFFNGLLSGTFVPCPRVQGPLLRALKVDPLLQARPQVEDRVVANTGVTKHELVCICRLARLEGINTLQEVETSFSIPYDPRTKDLYHLKPCRSCHMVMHVGCFPKDDTEKAKKPLARNKPTYWCATCLEKTKSSTAGSSGAPPSPPAPPAPDSGKDGKRTERKDLKTAPKGQQERWQDRAETTIRNTGTDSSQERVWVCCR